MVEITREIIEEVKKYAAKYPDLTQADLARLLGIGQSTVSRILSGGYDEQKPVETQIPYEKFRRLVICEEVVDELLRNLKASTDEDEDLFISFHTINNIMRRMLPEEYEARKAAENGRKKF